MLNIILVDDERPALNLLGKLLGDRPDVRVVGAYTNPGTLLEAVPELRPDVIFLDIEMPGISGLELAAKLTDLHEDVEIVFVTAYRQYAVEAFRVNAVDYLLKPVEPEWLERTLARIAKRKRQPTATASVSQIVCLGSFEVKHSLGSEPIRFPTTKTEELLAYFLVHRETSISKWTICESLWPGHEADKAEQNLHTTVYRLKKTLAENGIPIRLTSGRGEYRFEYDEECDYIRFERLMKNDGSQQSRAALEESVRMYRGRLFGSKDYLWCETERERLDRQFARTAKTLAAACRRDGEPHHAVDALRNVIATIPLDEEAHEQLLAAYLELKDRTSFLTHYEKFEKILRLELGLAPRAELASLYREIAAAPPDQG